MRWLSLKFWNLFRKLDLLRTIRRDRKRRSRSQLILEALEDRSLPSATASGIMLGTVFVDHGGTGKFVKGDLVIPGAKVTITGTTSFHHTKVDATAITNKAGTYTFFNVLPGTYSISVGPVPNVTGGEEGPRAKVGIDSISDVSISGAQEQTHNFGFKGLSAKALSVRNLLSSATAANSLGFGTPGSGTADASARANSAPIVNSAIKDFAVPLNSGDTAIDLAGHFTDPDFTNSEVTLNTNLGPLDLTLFDSLAPQTVANFFDYIDTNSFNGAVFTRLVSSFVLQGGSVTLKTATSAGTTTSSLSLTPTNTPVPNEFNTSNTADTVAMALSGGDPNSGTDQFFINLVDNSSTLNAQKFTVFGKLADTTALTTLSKLEAVQTQNFSTSSVASSLASTDLQNVPLQNNPTVKNFPTDVPAADFLEINSVTTDKRTDFLTYKVVGNSDPSLVTASVSEEHLTLNYAPGQVGTATIVVQATDSLGATVDDTFRVTVNPAAPKVTAVTITPDNPINLTKLTATAAASDPQGKKVNFSFQWLQNGSVIPGATSAVLNLTTTPGLTVHANDKFSVEVTPNDGLLAGPVFTSQTVTVASVAPITLAPPAVTAATITTNSPTNSNVSVLSVSPTTTDSDNKTVTNTFQWLHNGTPISGATSSSLNLLTTTGLTVKAGDTFAVEITPSDGTQVGSQFTTKTVTIGTINPITISPPVVNTVVVTPDSLTAATVLTATPTATDPDGKNVTFSFQWLQNGVAIAGATGGTLSLNTTVGLTLKVGDKLSVQVTPNDGSVSGAPFISGTVTVNTLSPVTFSPPVVTNVVITPDDTTDANVQVLTATPTATDPDGKPVTFKFQWLQNGNPITGQTANTLNLTTLTSVNPTDTFSVQVTPSDGTITGTTFTSKTVTVATVGPITLSPPVVTSGIVTPNDATNANITTLTVTPTATDPDGKNVNLTFQWLQNGSPISGATSQTLNLTTTPGLTVSAGDKFSVEITPNDGSTTGAQFTTSTVTIGTIAPITLSPPVVTSAPITSDDPTNTDVTSLTVAPVATDPDGKPVTFSFQWQQNGNNISGANGSTLVLTAPGLTVNPTDTFTVLVTPNDGSISGSVFSNFVTIATTNPITLS